MKRLLLNGWIMMIMGTWIHLPAQVLQEDPGHADLLNNVYITSCYQAGFVLPEYKYFLQFVEDHVQSIGLIISKKTTGKNDWEQIYGYPEYGFSFFYSTLGNDSVFGRELAVYPFFSYPIFSAARWGIFNQIGLGLNYVNRKFDLDNNYQNIVIGSKLNLRFNFRLELRAQVMKRGLLHTGLSFEHFSNANMQEPNIGINSMNLYVALGYCIGELKPPGRHELKPHSGGFCWEFTYAFGGKHTRAFQENYFITSSGTVEIKWKPYRMFRLGAGADIFYDSSTETEMKALDLNDYRKQFDFRSGIHVSQEIMYSRVSLIIQEGIYLFLTDQVNHKTIYNRGIIRYAITDHWLVSLSMKSHLHILDYPELGLCFRL